MTMVMISPSRREVSPAEQLCRSPRLVPPRFRLVAAESRPERFSLILQGLHKEGECRQLELLAEKGANIRDLFCTTPKVLKLHESYFWK